MTKLLYVEASPRGDRSYSSAAAAAFLETYRAAHPADTIDKLDLWSVTLPRFDGDMLNAKYAIMHGQSPSAKEAAAWAEVQTLFQRFNAADKYLISLPMWNFGIPYVLKHYIDVITQPGLAWSFDPASGYTGLVKGSVCAIYASAGAYHAGSGAEAFDLQRPYLENWLAFIGLTDVRRVTIAGTLGAPEDTARARAAGIEEARQAASTF